MAKWSMPLLFFFFSLIIAWNGFWQFFFLSPIFGPKSWIYRKKMVFWLVVRGIYRPTPLVVRPIKKNFLGVSSLILLDYFKAFLIIFSTQENHKIQLKDPDRRASECPTITSANISYFPNLVIKPKLTKIFFGLLFRLFDQLRFVIFRLIFGHPD